MFLKDVCLRIFFFNVKIIKVSYLCENGFVLILYYIVEYVKIDEFCLVLFFLKFYLIYCILLFLDELFLFD